MKVAEERARVWCFHGRDREREREKGKERVGEEREGRERESRLQGRKRERVGF